MAPSNSMNTITRPLSTRPIQSAGFETGAVSAIVGMALSLKGDWCMPLGRTGPRRSDRRNELFFLDFSAVRLAVAHQAVEMHPDVGGFGGSVGERDGAVERDPSLVVAAQLHQERAAHAEEMEIIRKPLRQRLDHLE